MVIYLDTWSVAQQLVVEGELKVGHSGSLCATRTVYTIQQLEPV